MPFDQSLIGRASWATVISCLFHSCQRCLVFHAIRNREAKAAAFWRLGCSNQIDDLSHYITCPHLWNFVRTAFPNSNFRSTLDRLCIGSDCTVNLRVLAATFQAYHASKPFSAVCSTAVFDAAKRRFEDHFYVAVRSSGLSPASPAD